MITAYQTKEGEQYTMDLLRKAEQKDLEAQRKFLESIIEREMEEERLKKEQMAKQRAMMKKRMQRTRPTSCRHGHRKER